MKLRIIFLCLFCAVSNELYAYSFTSDFNQGFYWASLPVRINKFAVDDNEGQLLSDLVDRAQNEWESSVGREIWDMNSGYLIGGFSGNNIRWSNNFSADTGYDPVGTLAVTIRYQSGTHVIKTEIILNGEMRNLRNNTNNMLYTTILHELGHTIGIGHSEQYAVMYPSLNGLTTLTHDDEAAANAVISETERRQSIGYISPYASKKSSDSSRIAACGSIGELTGVGGPKGGFFMTIMLGFMLVFIGQLIKSLLKPKESFSLRRIS